MKVNLDAFEGDPPEIVPALVGDSKVEDSLNEFSISLVMA